MAHSASSDVLGSASSRVPSDVAVLWLLLGHLGLRGRLGTEAMLATVVTVAAMSDAISSDTGLVAAISMGIVITNLHGVHVPEDRPFLKTVVQLTIGILFISISATVTPASLRGVVWPTIGLIAGLVLLVRPVVALLATVRTDLTRNERIFVGCMDPRGIVAASTASTFSAPLDRPRHRRSEQAPPRDVPGNRRHRHHLRSRCGATRQSPRPSGRRTRDHAARSRAAIRHLSITSIRHAKRATATGGHERLDHDRAGPTSANPARKEHARSA